MACPECRRKDSHKLDCSHGWVSNANYNRIRTQVQVELQNRLYDEAEKAQREGGSYGVATAHIIRHCASLIGQN